MNYLAHIFLSGTDRKLQFGNFIGDAVKGNSYKEYPPTIAKGVLLHRAIDSFTDHHPIVRERVRLLRPYFGRYSGVILDIYFDYLLASRFNEFSEIPLKQFARSFYWTMILNYRYLPQRIKRFTWHFISTNRLGKYATTEGIQESLSIMVQVGRIDICVESVINYLVENEEVLWKEFCGFMKEAVTVFTSPSPHLPHQTLSP